MLANAPANVSSTKTVSSSQEETAPRLRAQSVSSADGTRQCYDRQGPADGRDRTIETTGEGPGL